MLLATSRTVLKNAIQVDFTVNLNSECDCDFSTPNAEWLIAFNNGSACLNYFKHGFLKWLVFSYCYKYICI